MPIKEYNKHIFHVTCEIQNENILDTDTSWIHCYGSEEFGSKEDALKSGWKIIDNKCWCPNCIKPLTNNWTIISGE